MLTQEEIEAIRKRAEMATEGPWEVGYDEFDSDSSVYVGEEEITPIHRYDAEFIAHARTDIPKLLAEVDRLRGLIRESVDLINVYSNEEWAIYERLKEAIANDIR